MKRTVKRIADEASYCFKTLSIDSVQDEQSLKTNDVPIRITELEEPEQLL